MHLSVVIPSHNPNLKRLQRTLNALRAQTLQASAWSTILVDNASQIPIQLSPLADSAPANLKIVREERLGLTAARRRGFLEARGEIVVLVDDDNVLAPDYLAKAGEHFSSDPSLGAAGGRSLPEFQSEPPSWMREFQGLLALRDLGTTPQRASWRDAGIRAYPRCAPIGAGMAVRREAALRYVEDLDKDPLRAALDRTGTHLVSGGDNDLVMAVLEQGFDVAYLPELTLTHLIPSERLDRTYLGTLNRAIARSWVRVLSIHGIVIWRPISRHSVPFRQARAWFRSKAWSGPAEWVRWQGLCGTFLGQADIAPATTYIS